MPAPYLMNRPPGFALWFFGVALATLNAVWAADPAPAAGEVPRKYYVEDIKAAMTEHIASRIDADGVFHLRDDKTSELLALRFVKIHDPVRRIDGRTYFACTDFHVVGEPDKLYDLDFWLRPDGVRLRVYDEKVHKEPRHSLVYGWYKHPRYTFVKDKVVLLY
jgi:hypothetical protein